MLQTLLIALRAMQVLLLAILCALKPAQHALLRAVELALLGLLLQLLQALLIFHGSLLRTLVAPELVQFAPIGATEPAALRLLL